MALPNTVLSGRYDTQSNPFDASVAGNTVGIYRSGQYYTSIGVSGFGSSAAVLTVEATPDNGATWVPAQARQNAVDTLGGTISADGFYLVVSGLATHLRLRVTTAGPTTLTVSRQGGQDKDLSALSLGGGGASDPAVAAGIGAPADTAWGGTGSGTVVALLKSLYGLTAGVRAFTINGMLPAGTNLLGSLISSGTEIPFIPISNATTGLTVGPTATINPVALALMTASTYRIRNAAASASPVAWRLATANTGQAAVMPVPNSTAGTGGTVGDKTIDPGGVEIFSLTVAQQAAIAAGTLYLSAITPAGGSATIYITPGVAGA